MKNNFVGWEYLLAFVDDEIVEKLSKNCPNVMRNVEKTNSDLWIVLLLKRTLR